MVLIMVGDFDVDEAMDFVKDHQDARGSMKPLMWKDCLLNNAM